MVRLKTELWWKKVFRPGSKTEISRRTNHKKVHKELSKEDILIL